MKDYIISREWYEEIKDLVENADPFFFTRKYFGKKKEYVEADFNEEQFERVSKELGWIV